MLLFKPVSTDLGATYQTSPAAIQAAIVGNVFSSNAPTVTPGFWSQGSGSMTTTPAGYVSIGGKLIPTWLVVVGLLVLAVGGYKLYKRKG